MTKLFDFDDASMSGDPRWAKISPRFSRRAPWVVLTLAILSIVEIVIGVIWIVSIQSRQSLSFVQIIQPLVVPALSFFNTIPSLHLHVLARANQPLVALIFSSCYAVMFLASAVIFLPPCVGSSEGSYADVECPTGNRRGVWASMVALQFVSFLGYAIHAAMAWWVWRGVSQQDRAVRSGVAVELVSEEEKREREEEARRRWREMGAGY